MPRGDRTGPVGGGPMSGRAAGLCAGFDAPGYANPGPGRGSGMGFGHGRGSWGRGFGAGGREQGWRGGGRGRGWRHGFHATGQPGWMRFGWFAAPGGQQVPSLRPDPQMEKQALRDRTEALQSELDSVRRRLRVLEAGAETE